jgi:hypothetical protein
MRWLPAVILLGLGGILNIQVAIDLDPCSLHYGGEIPIE